MWDGFSRLLSLTPEIQDLVIWGKSDEKLGIGFSFAHYLAKMKPEEQRAIIDISWENERVITKEDLKKIQQYLKDNPEKTIEQTIEYVLGIRRISSTIEITHHFMSDLYPEIYEKLDAKAKKENKSIKQVAKEIFSKKFKADSIKAVSPRKTWVNITFSGPGRKELNRIMEESGVGRNDIVNYIFNQEEILWQ